MIKSNIKALIAFVLGAGSGAGTVYYILKTKYEQQINDEAEHLKEYYENYYNVRIEELNNRILLLETNGKASTEKESKNQAKKAVKKPVTPDDLPLPPREEEHPQKTDYNAISAKPKKVVHKKSTLKGPQIITFEEFTSDKKHEKICYTYLDQEDMILDENNEPVEDAYDEIGEDFKEVDNGPDGDNRYVYVRNDSIGKDFEIVIDVYHTYKQFLIEEGY